MRISISELKSRVEAGYAALKECRLCPRNCGVNRLKGEEGFCHTAKIARVASHNVHTGEEPPISGERGSGTIFFGSCNLRCKFCQNYPISQLGAGSPTTPQGLAQMMLSLQAKGCHNINIVTGSHVVPQFLAGLYIACHCERSPSPLACPPVVWRRGEGRGEGGLSIPIVWNSSGYDGLEALKLLDGVVDIYMPDIKYSSNDVAEHYSAATNYWDIIRPVIKEMHRQVGDLQFCHLRESDVIPAAVGGNLVNTVAIKGLLIRHLVLPGGGAGTEKILEFIANEISPDTYISLMSQYFPAHSAMNHPTLNRRITSKEYQEAVDILHRLGLENGWIQPQPSL